MQFDLDIFSPQAATFIKIREIIITFSEIQEYKTAKQTTYKDTYSAVCMLRIRHKKVRLSFANGASIHKKFTSLLGSAKIVRYLEFEDITEIDESEIKKMINESLLLNMEKHELRLLKKSL